ncbi:MAG TPA: EFR1 family ferrodoxin [Bacteroidales bacterium]|nr:EFR1 family ferrodoxin [Bacteroidales bacterium]HPT22595.1 EFR1 family ferrodoxin [Bacteroidales bacterium]
MELIIYYFTGTGNSQNVSSWVSSVAENRGIKCSQINIAYTDRINIPSPSKDALVVFISPIHGFNYPPVMLNFIARFPKGKNRVVLMNTRAGMRIGKFVTPGLTGIAFYLSSLFLWLKGYRVNGMVPVDLPSNWISLHPGLNEKTVRYLHEKNKERVTKHAEKFLSGQKDFRALREIVQDIAITPISAGYYFIGRFFLAKTFYASSDCNNCDICIKNCPVKAIVKRDSRPYWTFRCESCMRCMSNCPKRSIETAHGFVVAFLLFNSLLLTPLFYKYTGMFFTINSAVIRFIAEYALLFLFLSLLYRIIHFLMRFRIFERLMVFTSLTKINWWRRYKGLKNF